MGNNHNDGHPREEINYASELAQDGWCLVGPPWHGRNDSPVGIDLDSDPVARLLRETVGVWPGDRSQSFKYFRAATPWVTSAAEILERLRKGKSEDRLRAEGCPGTVEEVEARLRRVIPALRAVPRPFWDVVYSEESWERHVREGRFQKAYTEAVLHAELWRNHDHGKELYAFVALEPSDRREPRPAIDQAVYLHVAFPDGFEPVIEDEDNSYDRF
ncbi:MAG: hypothetical protein M3R38_24075 [Actinomycetota bacterium]|nr:hypothetical protein [Actinomycetota bacterium]